MTRFNDIAIRSKLIFLVFVVTFNALGINIYNLQIHRHEELYAKAKNLYTSVSEKKGKRGEIFDYDGNLLV